MPSRAQPKNISIKELERAARIYKTAADAGKALGIRGQSFSRACKRAGIELPKR